MQICLIGPSYPFRGGIAHHTTLLYRYLRKRHRVTFYAFKRQYPDWFFPGKTDRDPSKTPLQEGGIDPILDSINPVSWWHVYKRIKEDRPELVIIPWWSSFWTPQFWTIATLVRRLSPVKILFICHNIVDHESRILSKICTRAVLRKGDYFFVHSSDESKQLREMIPSAHITQAFHPLYDFFYSWALAKTEARTRLGLKGDTILFFGFVRPYKGLDDLLTAMPLILKERRVTLLVVGEFWVDKDAFARRVRELGIKEAVRVVNRYVPNEEVGLYFSAADLVVLPYVSGTGSGVVQAAYGFDKPVVATRAGSLPEVVEEGRTGYLVNPGDPKGLAEAVIRFYKEEKEGEFIENIRSTKMRFSWEKIVRLIEELAPDGNPLLHRAKSPCMPL